MTPFASGIYIGAVTHTRFSPTIHHLKYGVFQLLLDVDEIPLLSRKLSLFSHNRINIFSHHDSDHADGKASPLRDYVEATLRAKGFAFSGGRIQLLCMPRLFGFVFNPLSIYFCYDDIGILVAILYEVNNTFGQRHTYLIAVDSMYGRPVRQTCRKILHVSPFMSMDMTYDFTMSEPGASLATKVDARDASGAVVLTAAFSGTRREMTDAALLKALAAHPLLTVKVVTAIHFEAIKLWLKGMQLKALPPPPSEKVTYVSAAWPFGVHKSDKQSA